MHRTPVSSPGASRPVRILPALVVLLLLAVACGGGAEPTADPTSASPGTAPDPATAPTSADADEADGADDDPTAAEDTAMVPSPSARPGAPAATPGDLPALTTLTLAGTGLPVGDYTVVVDTPGGPVVATVPFDGTAMRMDLGETDPAAVAAVGVHAAGGATDPPLLSGSLADGRGTLTVAAPVDLGGARGQYILATPTDGPDSNERSGIWYVLIPRAPGLVLPVLPDGWVYEGWVRVDGVDLTTGRFSDPATPDDFDGFSGDQGGPPLPGEDFLLGAPPGTTFPVDLAGSTTFVTLEPAADPDPGPSGLVVLTGEVPPDADDHVVYDLTSAVADLPTLTATAAAG